MEIETKRMKLSKLKPNPNNPRRIGKTEMERLVKSLQDFPEMLELREIIIDENNIILGGNMRYRALKQIGEKECVAKVVTGLTVDQKREFIIKDNSSFGQYDMDALANLWSDLPLVEWGVNLPEDWLAGDKAEVKEDDFDAAAAAEAIVNPITKPGDVWLLGKHRVMCGDSTDDGSILLLMNGATAGMILSDPPYGMFLDTDFSTIKGSMKSIGRKNNTEGNKYKNVIGDHDDFKPELITTFFKNFGYCQEMFLFGADYFAELIESKNDGSWLVWDKRKESQSEAIGAEFELCWPRKKHKRRMLRHDWFGFLSSSNPTEARNRVHPTQKPTTLFSDIMQQWGSNPDIVVDLYLGSGTTLIACEQLGRTCYGMEIDPVYCDVIVKRWETLTGQKAVLDERP